MHVTEMIRNDHEEVRQMFHRFEQMPRSDGRARQELLDQIGEELEVHAMTEEKVFYPALRRVNQEKMEHSQHEHQEIRAALGDAQGHDAASTEFEAKVRKLMQTVTHHMQEEEGPIFAETEQRLGGEELMRLGREFQTEKQQIKNSILQRGLRAVKQAAQKIA